MNEAAPRAPIHILLASDNNYLVGLYTTLASIVVANRSKDELAFHVIDTGIKDAERKRLAAYAARFANAMLEFVHLDNAWFDGLSFAFRGGVSAYARLAMGKLLDIPKCVYIDVDMLVLRDIRELWDTPMEGNVFMAALEECMCGNAENSLAIECPFAPQEEVAHYKYFNSGIMLCDLDAYRAAEVFPQALRLMSTHGALLAHGDQTLLNYICRGKIGVVSAKWNIMPSFDILEDGSVYHYLSRKKPWDYARFHPGAKLWKLFYSIFVKDYFRYTPPMRIRMMNIVFHVRAIAASLSPSLSCILLKFSGAGMVEIKLKSFEYFRKGWLHCGMDAESRRFYKRKKNEWKALRDSISK